MKKALLLIGVILLAGCSTDDSPVINELDKFDCYSCRGTTVAGASLYYQDPQCGSIREVKTWMDKEVEGRVKYIRCMSNTDGRLIEVSK